MGEAKEHAKQLKKEAKAQTKLQKKRGEQPGTDALGSRPTQCHSSAPSERSAMAAEKQVKLQTLRVWIAVVGVVLALITLLATLRPWQEKLEQATPPKSLRTGDPESPPDH